MGIYNPLKNLVAGKGKNALSVDRPTVIFLTVEPPVDRAKPVGRPPGRPATPESWVLSVGRPPGRPAYLAGLCARLVHIGRPVRSTALWSGRSSGQPPADLADILGLKAWLYILL